MFNLSFKSPNDEWHCIRYFTTPHFKPQIPTIIRTNNLKVTVYWLVLYGLCIFSIWHISFFPRISMNLIVNMQPYVVATLRLFLHETFTGMCVSQLSHLFLKSNFQKEINPCLIDAFLHNYFNTIKPFSRKSVKRSSWEMKEKPKVQLYINLAFNWFNFILILEENCDF